MRPTLNILSHRQIAHIIAEARHLLAEIGIAVQSVELRRELLARGVSSAPSSDRLLFPAAVVDKALATAPGKFTLFNIEYHQEIKSNMAQKTIEQNLFYNRKAGKIVLTKDMDEELRQLIREGRKVEAVKRVFNWTRSGLKVSKDYVDALAQDL